MDWYTKGKKRQGKPVLWVHPITGDIKFPPSEDAKMPSRYEIQGFERREFSSYYEHAAFCKKVGLVNHAIEGVGDAEDAQLSRWGY